MNGKRPNIAFAGLTAAGKTTHAKILAEQLGYTYVSATEIILEILNIADNPDTVWFTNYDEIEKAREGDKIDIELEHRVRELANNNDGLVLDTWAMAYIYDGPLIRIWIESDEASRTRKCFVSQNEKTLDLAGCKSLITQKDGDTREKFLRRLNFDLFTDMSKYDAVISNSSLIPEATDESSQLGIHSFTPVVKDVSDYLINRSQGALQSTSDLLAKHSAHIDYLSEQPWSFKGGL